MNDIGKESHRSQVIAGIAVSTNKTQRLTRASFLHWRVASFRSFGFQVDCSVLAAEPTHATDCQANRYSEPGINDRSPISVTTRETAGPHGR
jgi:hypothetical protein